MERMSELVARSGDRQREGGKDDYCETYEHICATPLSVPSKRFDGAESVIVIMLQA